MLLGRRARSLAAFLLLVAVLAGACSDDDGATDTTAITEDGDQVTEGEGTETGTPVVSGDEERDFGIAVDPRASEVTEAAQAHFGDRWAGASFDIPEDEPPVMRLHVVEPSDDDREWVRELVNEIEADWVELVEVVEAQYSWAEISAAFETLLNRMGTADLALPVELDVAGNRIVVVDDSVEASVREELREGLAEGIVLFLDEIPADEDDDEEEE